MQITASLARHLRTLSRDINGGTGLAADLNQLAIDLTRTIPSCVAVSIVSVRLRTAINVSVVDCAADSAAVLASLAVPLTADPGDMLVLQAAEAGAFLMLADDLVGLLGPGHPPMELDRHLRLPIRTGDSFAASLGDLGAINRAIGVLIDRGFPRETAWRELQRRADAADLTLGVASGLLLASLAHRTERSDLTFDRGLSRRAQ